MVEGQKGAFFLDGWRRIVMRGTYLEGGILGWHGTDYTWLPAAVQRKLQDNHCLESYTVWLILPSLYKSLVVVVVAAAAAVVVVIAVTLLCVLLELRCNKCWNASTTTDDFDSCLRLRIFVQQNCWENSPLTPPPAVSLLRFSQRFLPPLALLRMCVVENSSGGAIAVVAAGTFSPLDRLI